MSTTTVERLYPLPAGERPLKGVYLDHDLRRQGTKDRPFVYTDFIASLDGRISEPDPETDLCRVPAAIANPRDWRLYMELIAQTDVILTTDRHLRAVAAGHYADLLTIADREYPDLAAWRSEKRLPPHPACVALSPRLDIPAEALCERHPGKVLLLANEDAPRTRMVALEAAGAEVLLLGPGPYVEGDALVRALARRGYVRIYSIAGPRMLHTLVEANVLDRLYLTLATLILGGERFDTLTRGGQLQPPRGFRLHALYLDSIAPAEVGQLFASFDRMYQDRESPGTEL